MPDFSKPIHIGDGVYLHPDNGYHVAIISTDQAGKIFLNDAVWNVLVHIVHNRRAELEQRRLTEQLPNNLVREKDE